MEKIKGLFKNSGEEIDIKELGQADYIQLELQGKHAKETTTMALISTKDLNLALDFDWYLSKNGYPMTFGSKTNKRLKFGRGKKIHQIIFRLDGIKLSKPYVIDHINHNKLDNRRENLRICTQKQNSYNTSKRNNKYKGVIKNKNGTFSAQIFKDGIKHELKGMSTIEEAAKMYDIMSEELFGEYAGKNF